jgi:hypothetical protein
MDNTYRLARWLVNGKSTAIMARSTGPAAPTGASKLILKLDAVHDGRTLIPSTRTRPRRPRRARGLRVQAPGPGGAPANRVGDGTWITFQKLADDAAGLRRVTTVPTEVFADLAGAAVDLCGSDLGHQLGFEVPGGQLEPATGQLITARLRKST